MNTHLDGSILNSLSPNTGNIAEVSVLHRHVPFEKLVISVNMVHDFVNIFHDSVPLINSGQGSPVWMIPNQY
jgi:hypothetical protein